MKLEFKKLGDGVMCSLLSDPSYWASATTAEKAFSKFLVMYSSLSFIKVVTSK